MSQKPPPPKASRHGINIQYFPNKVILLCALKVSIKPIYAYHHVCESSTDSAKPDQKLHKAASDQVLYCLLTECSIQI